MVSPTPTPSTRLLRAVAAERAELDRHREKLLAGRESLRAELARIEGSLTEIDERAALLDRLAGSADRAVTTVAGGVTEGTEPPGGMARSAGQGGEPLRGPAIRRAAVRVLLEHPERPEALHYRDWYDAVRAAGYEVAGKDPLAVFLTQLSRSPVVRKGTQSGVYELDRSGPRRLRLRLDELHDELRALTATPSATADLAAIRAQRAELNADISQVEKALEEAESLIAAGQDPGRLAAAG
jgi:septal ring factor EnvC (AmiA/AmiB activator)